MPTMNYLDLIDSFEERADSNDVDVAAVADVAAAVVLGYVAHLAVAHVAVAHVAVAHVAVAHVAAVHGAVVSWTYTPTRKEIDSAVLL